MSDQLADHGTRKTDLLQRLAEAAETLATSEGWLQRLQLARKFHHLSPTNQWLVAIQDPQATYTKTFKGWLALGRCVRKGEKAGIWIFQPRPFTKERTKANGEVVEDRFTAFRLVAHFDIRQTDPIPDFDGPVFEPPKMPDPASYVMGLLTDLEAVAADAGIEVRYVDYKPGPLGWFEPGNNRIVIVEHENYGDVLKREGHRQATLLHELGHALDPDITKAYSPDYPRPEAELVAESVAYIVGGIVGLDVTAQATHYLASWRATPERMAQLQDKVLAIASRIERALEPEKELVTT